MFLALIGASRPSSGLTVLSCVVAPRLSSIETYLRVAAPCFGVASDAGLARFCSRASGRALPPLCLG